MKQSKWKESLPSCLASFGLLAFSIIFFLLYRFSLYVLFRLSGIFLLLMAAVNLIFIIFNKEPSELKSSPEPEKKADAESEKAQPADAEQEPAGAKKGKEKGARLRALDEASGRILRFCARKIKGFFRRAYRYLSVLLLLGVSLLCFIWFGAAAWAKYDAPKIEYWHLALVAILFVIAVVADSLCKHAETEDRRAAMLNRNACVFFKLTKVLLTLTALALTLKLLNILEICIYVVYLMTALFYYVGVMIVISLAVRVFRKELVSSPGVVILLPFFSGDIKELAVLSFLEENTGITLRSLWSLKFVKNLLPYAIVCAAVLFWASTGIVYVESNQEAAVYRFGDLADKTLTPGLHMTLPYPIDRTEIYDTTSVRGMTIGYTDNGSKDNVWTEAHGENEYRLLMGSGKELMSINLKLEYRISDLNKYLKCSSTPERILEANAYELITERTIKTDLNTILATDRSTFANTFYTELRENIKKFDTGLELMNVVVESIHPPVEVADVYQEFLAASIQAERLRLEAEAECLEKMASAETAEKTIISYANIDYNERTAAATAEISQFLAAVEASNLYPDEYRYYKYLDAVCRAYKNARLVIVGNDVDSSRLYFGSIPTSD